MQRVKAPDKSQAFFIEITSLVGVSEQALPQTGSAALKPQPA
jgi:hypothetical protein